MNKDEIIIEEVTSSDVREDYKLKVVIVGDSGVGKSNLIKRFTSNEFNANSKATVGVEFLSKSYKINDKIFKIEMWDTAGQERYKSITSAYYKGAKGALLVYDTTSGQSFENISKWLSEIKEKTNKETKLILIGNKIDLKDSKVVSTELALAKAKEWGMPLMETSAKDATNVKEAFHDLLKEMYFELNKTLQMVENKKLESNNAVQLDVNEEKKKKGCC
jgi:small GTP-binding protein